MNRQPFLTIRKRSQVPHLLCSRTFEVRIVRLHVRRLTSVVPCKRLPTEGLQRIERFSPVNGYDNPGSERTKNFPSQVIVH